MKKIFTLIILFIVIFSMSACLGKNILSTGSSGSQYIGFTTSETITSNTGAASVGEVLAENSPTHEDAADYVWDSSTVVPVTLNGYSIESAGDGLVIDGTTISITSAGTYSFSGTLSDGQIIVNTESKGPVRLIFNGIDIHSSASAPVYIMNGDEAIIILADDTENNISDASSYVFEDPTTSEPNAAIFSMSDLTIFGNGSLTVNGSYMDGISSKDGLIITGSTVTVTAVDDGIRGKDYLVVKNGNLMINAQGNGLLSDNEEDTTQGYISIEAGTINITAGGDAISAATDVVVSSGALTLSSGGGSNNRIGENTSAKGIKGVISVEIDGGTFMIDSADDAIHSNGSVVVNNGNFSITTADDGIHADSTIDINGGDIQISRSYEGIESAVITVNAGNIHVVSSDDGINVAGGVDSSGMIGGDMRGQGPGQDTFSYTGDYYLYINGGYISVEAYGDGLDINGAIEMTGGIVLVNGPTENMNGALDYDGGFKLTGGYIVAAGSAGMAMAPGTNSSQNSILVYLDQVQQAGSLVHIQNSAGEDILTFSPTREYQSIAFSSSQIVNGDTYEIYLGGSSSGTSTGSLFQDGTYTPGAKYASFTVSSVVTTIGTGGFGGGGRPGRP